jgi:hypothetical protein
MKRLLWTFTTAILIVTLLPAAISVTDSGPALAQVAQDDELVIVERDGRIVVWEPSDWSVPWESESTGWQKVATGDFNGDGAVEILAIRGGEAKVFDPDVPPGTDSVSFEQVIQGEVWNLPVTGDIDGDGRDEIILTRSTDETGIEERLLAWDGNATGTSWTLTYNAGFGGRWRDVATGDVNGDGKDEVAAIRNVSGAHTLLIWEPITDQNWLVIYNENWDFPWLDIAIGDTHVDSGDKDELLLSREGVEAQLPSFLVFRWRSTGSDLEVVERETFFPYFHSMAAGDINENGTDEVFLLRRIPSGSSPALIDKTYGPDYIYDLKTLDGQSQWDRVELGDLDGDRRDEAVVMSDNNYRVYWQPEENASSEERPGSYITTGWFAIGDVDGATPTQPSLGLSRTTVTVSIQAGQGGSEDVQVVNNGSGTLNWTASVESGSNWLSLTPSSGVAPSTLRLEIRTAGLAVSSYTGRVRVDGGAGVLNSPQYITVNLEVTAPPLAVTPSTLSWYHIIGTEPVAQNVRVFGNNVPWHAGVVPMEGAEAIRQAVDAGTPVTWQGDRFVIRDQGEGAGKDVPIVDWLDITPSSGVATVGGVLVSIDPIGSRVPYGVSKVAVVFVAAEAAMPRAVVVDVTMESRSGNERSWFLPLVQAHR